MEMRSHIVTALEREIILRYLEKGQKLPGFKVLKMRARQNYKHLLVDVELLIEFLEKLGEA